MTALLGRSVMLVAALVTAACSAPMARPTSDVERSRITLPPSPLTEEQRIAHVLNRLGYGPRPGDLARVKQMGLAVYIDRQLDPAGIPDDAADRAAGWYPTLGMSSRELAHQYPLPDQQVLAKVRSGEMTPEEVARAIPPERRPYRITAEVASAKLARAVQSERQLQEVMVDFWFNHFNVFALKGGVRWTLPAYESEALRPYALGRFRDLLMATARHPAMLFYLDNWMSTRAEFVVPAGPNKGRKMGLNENYARELMELHTLGVDGGYTQRDVIEVARCFTGWSIDGPYRGGDFVFRPFAHDGGEKWVLGRPIRAGGGESDGRQVIDILARHPATARFIATKLARRFVSDDPPAPLVDRVASSFLRSDGDIRAVLATIFSSPEFFAADAYRVKIKKPLELVASAVRSLGGEIAPPAAPSGPVPGGGFGLARRVASLGEPLYESVPPTGHPDVAEAWVNSGALIARMNFALALAHNRIPGVRVELDRVLGGVDRRRPHEVLARLVTAVLHDEMTHETRRVLAAQLGNPEITRVTPDDRAAGNTDVEKLLALVLGSPEFQRK